MKKRIILQFVNHGCSFSCRMCNVMYIVIWYCMSRFEHGFSTHSRLMSSCTSMCRVYEITYNRRVQFYLYQGVNDNVMNDSGLADDYMSDLWNILHDNNKYKYTRKHTHTHPLIPTTIHEHTRIHTNAPTNTHEYTRIHTNAVTNTHESTHISTNTHENPWTHTNTHKCPYEYPRIPTKTHEYTRMHTNTQAYPWIHMNIHGYPPILKYSNSSVTVECT
jgi:hypothetical protein